MKNKTKAEAKTLKDALRKRKNSNEFKKNIK